MLYKEDRFVKAFVQIRRQIVHDFPSTQCKRSLKLFEWGKTGTAKKYLAKASPLSVVAILECVNTKSRWRASDEPLSIRERNCCL